MAQAKICGITDAAALDAAIGGGARFVGFVFFPKSPRHLAPDKLAALAARARGRVETVLVTVDADDALLASLAAAARPDWIQLHGNEPPDRAANAARFARRGVIKALGVARADDLTQARDFEPVAGMLLFDAKPPPGALPGGNAVAFDWAIMAGRQFQRPWFLSGGLDPQNVAEAIGASGAGLVDVSTGVESTPGLKDPAKIAQFLAAVDTSSGR